MRQIVIIVIVVCIETLFCTAQQPKTVVFKVRKVKKEITTSKFNTGPAIVEESTYIVVEENASFNGGDLGAFRNWVQSNVVYPQTAKGKNIQGRVFIQFAINSRGDICDIKILRTSGNILLDNEAVRVIKTSPKWKAARQSGAGVKQQFTIPITFKLSQELELN